jgi:hypothetical protein
MWFERNFVALYLAAFIWEDYGLIAWMHKSINVISEELMGVIMEAIYEVWLWSPRNDFIAIIPVYLQLSERGRLRSTPLEQLHTELSVAATVRNIFVTPVVD